MSESRPHRSDPRHICGLAALLLLSACGHAPARPVIVAALPVAETLPADALPLPVDAHLLEPAVLRARLPADRRSPVPDLALVAALAAAEESYYTGDSATSLAQLETLWNRLKTDPGLLPQDEADRRQTYRSLLLLLRSRHADKPDTARPVATWLARHFPDQLPSVAELPPRVAALASAAVKAERKKSVALALERPADCPREAHLVVDGLATAGLPVAAVESPQGDHVWAVQCDGQSSWLRRIHLGEATTLRPPDVTQEHALLLGTEGLAIRPGTPREVRVAVARRLLPSLRVDALLVVDEREVLHVTPRTARTLPRTPGTPLAIADQSRNPRDWKRPSKWVALGLAAVATGAALGAHAQHDRTVSDMASGLKDTRPTADRWKAVAITGYTTGAAAATTALVLFILDALPPAPVDPMF